MATNPVDVAEVGKITASVLGGIATLAVIIRFVFRPMFDESVVNAIVRKSPDVEKHMRTEMFKADIAERARLQETIAAAVKVADANASAISQLHEEFRGLSPVLHSIPHMAGSMERLADEVCDLAKEQTKANDISRVHGEKIAGLLAVFGPDGRRHMRRRANDTDEPLDQPIGDDGT